MHSFRLRYVVLGLLVLVACSTGRRRKECGGRYTDPTSRTIDSHLVVQASLVNGAWISKGHRSATMSFKVRSGKPMKGSLDSDNSTSISAEKASDASTVLGGKRRRRTRKVQHPVPIRVRWTPQCRPKVALKPSPRSYVLFLGKPDVNGTYPLVGYPLLLPESMKSKQFRKITRQVRTGTCKRCVREPRVVWFHVKKSRDRKRRRASVTFKCKVVGMPRGKITWFKDGKRIKNKRNGRIRIRRSKKKHVYTLKITRVNSGNTGNYVCRGHNIVGSTESRTIRINVKKESSSGDDYAIDSGSPTTELTASQRLQQQQQQHPVGEIEVHRVIAEPGVARVHGLRGHEGGEVGGLRSPATYERAQSLTAGRNVDTSSRTTAQATTSTPTITTFPTSEVEPQPSSTNATSTVTTITSDHRHGGASGGVDSSACLDKAKCQDISAEMSVRKTRRSSSDIRRPDHVQIHKNLIQHSSNCASDDFCFNGGKCYMLKNSKSLFCRCSQKYVGQRCETKSIDALVRDLEIRNSHKIDRTLTHIGLSIGAITLLVLCSVAYCMARDKRKTFEKHSALIKKLKEKQEIVNADDIQSKPKKPLYINSYTQTTMPAPTPPSTSSNVSPKRHTIATPPGAPATTYATISPRHRLAGTSDTPLRPKQHPRRVVMAEMEPPRRVQSVDDNDRAIDSVDCDKTSGIPAPPRSTSLHHTLTAHLPQHPHSIHDHAPQHAPHHRSAQPRDGSVSCHARLDQCLAQDQLSEAISVASSVGEEKALFDRLLQSNRLTGGAGAGAGAGAAGGVEVDGRDRMSPDNRADLAGSLTSDTITSCSSSSSTLSGDDNEPLVIVEVGDRGYEYRGRDGRGHDLEVGGHGVERPLLGKQVSNGRLVVQHN